MITSRRHQTLFYLKEPLLAFGHGQTMEDPRDGLLLFGPLKDVATPYSMRIGVIGRKIGINRYKKWVKQINGNIPAKDNACHHFFYPGYEAIFGCKWPDNSICEIIISDTEIEKALYLSNRHEAIYKTVSIYENEIRRYVREKEENVDLWFIVIPEEIYTYGRPKSIVPLRLKIKSRPRTSVRIAKKLEKEPTLYKEIQSDAEIYKYEINFHNQIKARLLELGEVVQVVRETSLTPEEFTTIGGRQLRKVQDAATIAWNLTTTAFFKSAGRPWKLANVRDDVCYIGLVFKKDETSQRSGNACCGAQMFLDSGEGLVFRGAVGPWYSEETNEYHLSKERAKELMEMVINAYRRERGNNPKEMFIHGKTKLNDEEWKGFIEVLPKSTKKVGIRISKASYIKLFSVGDESIMRGVAYQYSKTQGYLWTKGYIPRLKTYPGRETPNPLLIEICKGEGDIMQIMNDIMGLTKLNFNSCIYADGVPVTLRFADRVGEILTATPISHDLPPLPFKYYI